ncbi:MAG: hypothetical protein JSV96_01960 [Candidatus Aminicenantes bacterium]|nr:MAG: hypothetical protein JSV96_01960 [Candidatus Aminicenantes bacterium]
MSTFLILFYIVLLIVAFSIFLYYLLSLRVKKKSLGDIKAQWSLFFNISFWINRFVLAAFTAYFLWCVYQIASDLRSSNGYHRLMILVFILSFTPRWNVYIGSKGILLRMNFIPWKNVGEKAIIARGKNRYLEISGSFRSPFLETETKRIRIPQNVSLDVELAVHNT